MKSSKLITIGVFFFMFNTTLKAQYNCSSPVVISSLPYIANNLTTSTGLSYQASGVCNVNYNEQDYIFQYSPLVEEELTISLSIIGGVPQAGIYVFTGCSQPPANCVAFKEQPLFGNGVDNLTFSVVPGTVYFIFAGTQGSASFNIDISKTEIIGVAINKSAPTQTLDVNGAIRVGMNTTTPYEGTIRWNKDKKEFEGYTGSEWVLLSPKKEFGYTPKHGLGIASSDGAASNQFGGNVYISGDYAIVGARFHNSNGNFNQGKSYVYKRNGSTWTEEALLTASDGTVNDRFGGSVCISGDYAIVSATSHATNGNAYQGKAYIYKRSGTTWTEQSVLTSSDGAELDQFGKSVSISGDYAIVGASNESAYVYKWSGTTWTEEAILTSSDGTEGDQFGENVAISGDYAIVCASLHDTNGNSNQGKTYVYKRNGSTWTEHAILEASDGMANAGFGTSVSISGDYVIVGAGFHNTNGNSNQGKAYVFKRNGNIWTEESALTASDGAAADQFGESVSISGDYALVGSSVHATNGNPFQGKAYVFKRNGDRWNQESILSASDGAASSQFGISVSISGEYIIVGAFRHNTNGNFQQGKVYFY